MYIISVNKYEDLPQQAAGATSVPSHASGQMGSLFQRKQQKYLNFWAPGCLLIKPPESRAIPVLNPCTALSNAPAPEPAYNNIINRTGKIAQVSSGFLPSNNTQGHADLISSIERAREGSRGYHGGGVVQDGGDGPVPLSLRRGTEERGQMEHHEGRKGGEESGRRRDARRWG